MRRGEPLRRKTEMRRSSGPARSSSLPAVGRRGRERRRQERNKADFARAFKLAVCGTLSPDRNAHHCLPKRWIEKAARSEGLTGDALLAVVYDPAIAIDLDARVHEQHTNRTRIIAFSELPESVIQRVAERWGEPGMVALEREHPWGGNR